MKNFISTFFFVFQDSDPRRRFLIFTQKLKKKIAKEKKKANKRKKKARESEPYDHTPHVDIITGFSYVNSGCGQLGLSVYVISENLFKKFINPLRMFGQSRSVSVCLCSDTAYFYKLLENISPS